MPEVSLPALPMRLSDSVAAALAAVDHYYDKTPARSEEDGLLDEGEEPPAVLVEYEEKIPLAPAGSTDRLFRIRFDVRVPPDISAHQLAMEGRERLQEALGRALTFAVDKIG